MKKMGYRYVNAKQVIKNEIINTKRIQKKIYEYLVENKNWKSSSPQRMDVQKSRGLMRLISKIKRLVMFGYLANSDFYVKDRIQAS